MAGEGEAAIRAAADAAEEAVPVAATETGGECPVQPLGLTWDDAFAYLDPAGRVVPLRAQAHDEKPIDGLFLGDGGWLWRSFPRVNAEGAQTGVDYKAARRWLMAQCRRVGFFEPDMLRAPGAWRAAGGGLILHCGDRVRLEDGEWVPAGCRVGRHVYPARARMPVPAAVPMDAAEAADLLELLESWHWVAPTLGPRLLLGFCAAAVVCGALGWRPHVLVSGRDGAGKTWLHDTVSHLCCGDRGLARAAGTTTEAGLRQLLGGAARPVAFDELERGEDDAQARAVIGLARIASAGTGAPIAKGSQGGQPVQYPVRSCFYISAINPPALDAADQGRITTLELGDLRPEPGAAEAVRARIDGLAPAGPRLLARMVEGWGRFEANLRVYRGALMAVGCDSRLTDQYATLLAAAQTALGDDTVGEDLAREHAADLGLGDFLPDRAEASDWAQCLSHLRTAPIWVESVVHGTRFSRLVVEQVRHALGAPEGSEARELKKWGLAVRRARDPADGRERAWVAVAHRHGGLEALFKGTRWSRQGWQVLRQHPEALRNKGTVNFAGEIQRAVWLPIECFPDPDAPDDGGGGGGYHGGGGVDPAEALATGGEGEFGYE